MSVPPTFIFMQMVFWVVFSSIAAITNTWGSWLLCSAIGSKLSHSHQSETVGYCHPTDSAVSSLKCCRILHDVPPVTTMTGQTSHLYDFLQCLGVKPQRSCTLFTYCSYQDHFQLLVSKDISMYKPFFSSPSPYSSLALCMASWKGSL